MELSYQSQAAGSDTKRNDITNKLRQNPTVKAFLSGSTSGTICTVLLQPLDVVKTRLQNPSFSIKSAKTGKSQIVEIVSDIIKHEGIKGLWKGTLPSLIRTVPGVGLYFSLLTNIKFTFFKEREPNPTESLFIGAIARSLAGATLMPLTVVKTRIESGVYSYTGVFIALREIFTHEGFKGLTKGLVPTIFRDAPFAGIYYMFYTQFKSLVPQDIYSIYTSPVHLACAVTSSTLASLATQPPDVFKTQMQLYPAKFKGLRSVIVHVYVQHGVFGYFQGILPRLLRRTLVSAISWTLYEKIMQNKYKY